jgi:hypothetical protein
MNRKGSVILHVLIIGTVVALIAASMLRMSLVNYLETAHVNAESTQKRGDEGALMRLASMWSLNNTSCASAAGYTCSGGNACSFSNHASCNCTSVVPGNPTPISGVWSAATNTCNLTITGSDPLQGALTGNNTTAQY